MSLVKFIMKDAKVIHRYYISSTIEKALQQSAFDIIYAFWESLRTVEKCRDTDVDVQRYNRQ